MKMYVTETQLRLVGKGWEIRHHLRKLAEQAGGKPASAIRASQNKKPLR